MTVLHFHGHKRLRCDGLGDLCAAGRCYTCDLYSCVRCGGAEASLPTDCPGAKISHEVQDDIAAGNTDYRWREGWVLLDAKGNPCDAGALPGGTDT